MADDIRFDIILNDAKALATLKRFSVTIDKALKTSKGFTSAFLGTSKAVSRMNKQLKTTDKLLKSMSKDLKRLAAIAGKLPKSTAKNFKQTKKVATASKQVTKSLQATSKQSRKVTQNFRNQAAAAAQVSSGVKGGLALLLRYGPAAAAAAVGIASIAAGVRGFRALVRAGTESEDALVGLQSVAANTGQNMDEATAAAQKFASEGLISIKESATSLKNLLAKGFSIDESVQLIKSLRDAAAFGKQAHLEFGEAIAGATEGIKNDNSIKSDNAGITENLSVMVKRYAKELGKIPGNLTKAEKNQAILNGFLREGALFAGNFSIKLGTFSGAVELASSATTLMIQELGRVITTSPAVLTAFRGVSDTIRNLTKGVTNNKSALQKFVKDGVLVLLEGLLLTVDGVILFDKAFSAVLKVTKKTRKAIGGITTEFGKLAKELDRITKLVTGNNNFFDAITDGAQSVLDVFAIGVEFSAISGGIKSVTEALDLLSTSSDIFSRESSTQEERLNRISEAYKRNKKTAEGAAEATKDLTKSLGAEGGIGGEITIEHIVQVDKLNKLGEKIDPLTAAIDKQREATESSSSTLSNLQKSLITTISKTGAASTDPTAVSIPQGSGGKGRDGAAGAGGSKSGSGPRAFNFDKLISEYNSGLKRAELILSGTSSQLADKIVQAEASLAEAKATSQTLAAEIAMTTDQAQKDILRGQLDNATIAGKAAVNDIKGFQDALRERASQPAGVVAAASLVDSFKDALRGASTAVDFLGISGSITSSMDTMLSVIPESITKFTDPIASAVSDVMTVIGSGMLDGLNAVLGGIKNTSDQTDVDVAKGAVSDRQKRIGELESGKKKFDDQLADPNTNSSEIKKLKAKQAKVEQAIAKEKQKLNTEVLEAEAAEKKKINNEGARTFVASTVTGIADTFIPGLGAALGPITGALLAGPEAIKEQLDGLLQAVPDMIAGLVESIPVIIEVLAERAPDIIIALVKAVPDIIDALIEASPDFIIALVEAAPEIGLALAEAMPRVAFALATLIPRVLHSVLKRAFTNPALQTFIDTMSGLTEPFQAFGDAVNRFVDSVTTGDGLDPTKVSTDNFGEKAKDALEKTNPIVDVTTTTAEAIGSAVGFGITGGVNQPFLPKIPTDPGSSFKSGGSFSDKELDKLVASFTNNDSNDTLILTQILAALEREQIITTSVEINQEAFADIMLRLNQDNARTT